MEDQCHFRVSYFIFILFYYLFMFFFLFHFLFTELMIKSYQQEEYFSSSLPDIPKNEIEKSKSFTMQLVKERIGKFGFNISFSFKQTHKK